MATTHLPGRHRLSPAHAGPRWGLASLMVAAGMAGWLLAVAGPDGPRTMTMSAPSVPQPVAIAAQDIQRTGWVTAVSETSLTTADAAGRTMTFAITPDTTKVHRPGATAFAPSEHVAVVAVVRDGVPVATAIVDRGATEGAGQPMDYGLPH
ncbi:MAG: hypothetical protein PGN37_17060 [Mycobacterium kyogaense]|uniref:hypothetical protein n=1 Tax=Mycobacterium kyogaense TaxID=2212479 RepID=UPI002FF48935